MLKNLKFSRFTTLLAEKAGHVTAVDIVESFVEENRKTNGHLSNVSFKTGEASVLKVDENRLCFKTTYIFINFEKIS